MISITPFSTYEAAESVLEKYLQRNLDVIGASQGFTVEERKQAGVENPLAEPGKELSLLVDLYWLSDAYGFSIGIRTLDDNSVRDFYSTMREFASAVKMRVQWYQRGEGCYLYGARVQDAVMVPFLYTVEKHYVHLPELNDEEKKEAKEGIMEELKETNLPEQQELIPFLEALFGNKPVVRGLTVEEQEEFVREYDKL